jgi:tetratricopeptide (TPR) repeat protein
MTTPTDFDRLLSTSQGSADAIALVDPDSLKPARPSAAAAWKLLSGSITLRHAGLTSEANGWFNASMSATPPEPPALLQAEQVAEGGLGLFAEKRWNDAAKILQGAAVQWADLCQVAVEAKPGNAKAAALAGEIASMLEALGVKTPTVRSKGAEVVKPIREWLEQRGVLRRAKVFAAYAQILAIAGQHDDARKVCAEEREWIERQLTSPSSAALPGRSMSGATRHALYRLMLARGELELAADAYQASVDGFAEAVKLYHGYVTDAADVDRMIQAHANQANSLLRLGRFDEALGIYGLAEMGFRSIGNDAGVARVQHAKLFAQMKKDEAGGS